MCDGFSVDFVSDTKYDRLITEISYKGQILCQLNKDKGINQVEIAFYCDFLILPEQVEFRFPLDQFITILNETKQALITS